MNKGKEIRAGRWMGKRGQRYDMYLSLSKLNLAQASNRRYPHTPKPRDPFVNTGGYYVQYKCKSGKGSHRTARLIERTKKFSRNSKHLRDY